MDGIRVTRAPIPDGLHRELVFWRFGRQVAEHVLEHVRPDVVHVLTATVAMIPWLQRIRAARVPVVYSATLMENPVLGAVRSRLQRLPAKYNDCVVANSTTMRDALLREGHKGRIEVIPNGVSLTRFRPADGPEEKAALRRQLKLPPDSEVLLFVAGGLTPRKGGDLLAAAWAEIARARPAARLVLVGPLQASDDPSVLFPEFEAGVRNVLTGSGAGDRVILAGRVDDVAPFLRAADVLVFPSRREGLPNVVLEAFASGLPVVLCPFVGLGNELGAAGREYRLVSHDPAEIVRVVIELMADPLARARMAASARQWVEEHMDREQSIDAYVRLYEELAGW